ASLPFWISRLGPSVFSTGKIPLQDAPTESRPLMLMFKAVLALGEYIISHQNAGTPLLISPIVQRQRCQIFRHCSLQNDNMAQ
ncbi:hypothetical protein LEMLEM_LOCUS19926, partial [Lemmus lemmus]